MATFYHVTNRENVKAILRDGIAGGWGDDGFGVYVYTDLGDAESYAARNGWDGELEDPVILEIEAPERDLDFIEINPEWPNPEDYENVRRFPMDPDEKAGLENWHPGDIRLLEDQEPGPAV
ncbi:hypothetical protein [Paracoccus sp. ME4]|uniref:hypothetical protein n=1 Tax=Paracoccus sp. ME4 TaxID=3138066 RepID=UPI00398ADB46